MMPYVLLYAVVASMAFRVRQGLGVGLLVFVVLMVGLRHEVGGDWLTYIEIFDRYADQSFAALMSVSEPGYALLNGLSARLGWSFYGANLFVR